MAVSLKRGINRSASCPTRLADGCKSRLVRTCTVAQHYETKSSPVNSPENNRSYAEVTPMQRQTTTPSSLATSFTSQNSINTSGTRTPVQRSSVSEVDLRMEDDFVEGGIELPPARPDRGGGDRGHASDDESAKFPTRPLPPLGDAALEEFWPAGSGPRALFLDYDGTLREFEARPELAVPTHEITELLTAINSRKDLVPHIISGRDARFLESYFGSLSRFTLIAEHGFQLWRPGTPTWELWDHPDGLDKDHDDWKVVVRAEMTDFVNSTPGSHIEEKASSLVWHYREVADEAKGEEAAGRAMGRLEELRNRHNIGKIRISHGHKVVEVSYRKVRKGPVMRRICEEKALFGDPFLSVFVAGDDTSDESMFDIAPDDFLTVKVGPAVTHAKFRVDSPQQLRKFLWQLISSS